MADKLLLVPSTADECFEQVTRMITTSSAKIKPTVVYQKAKYDGRHTIHDIA